jgi:salicylate hydroxylase
MRDAVSGGDVFRGALGDAVERRFGAPYVVTHRADLLDALLQACRACPLIELRTSAQVESVTEAGNMVGVRLKDESSIGAAALIGADGLWSTVRRHVIGDGPPRVSGHLAYRAVLPIAEVPARLQNDDVTLWAGPKSHLVHYKLRRGELFNLVAVFHSDRYVEGWDVAGDRAELLAHFAAATSEVQALLEHISDWRMWVLCDREPVRGWSRGRIALIGDAAHPTLQYLAQGAAMALEDAVCLAECLRAVDLRDADVVAAALAAFESARYRRTARVQLYARFYGELYHAAGVAREVRNEMLAGNSRGLEGMAWLYEGPQFAAAALAAAGTV